MKIKRKTLILWKRRLAILLSLFLAGGFIYAYAFTNVFSITSFSFRGVSEKDKEKLASSLKEVIASNTLYIIPGDKILTFNVHRISDTVKSILPNTASVRVYPSGLHTLSVSITPYVPLFRTGEGEAYDREGNRYKEQNDISHLPSIYFLSTTTPKQKLFENLDELLPQVSMLLFPTERILVDSYGDIYVFASGSKGRIILAEKSDFKKAWLALVSAIDTDPLKSSLEKNKEALEYIDLRFGNKVFYKFTNNEKPAIIPEHATTTVATSTPR